MSEFLLAQLGELRFGPALCGGELACGGDAFNRLARSVAKFEPSLHFEVKRHLDVSCVQRDGVLTDPVAPVPAIHLDRLDLPDLDTIQLDIPDGFDAFDGGALRVISCSLC